MMKKAELIQYVEEVLKPFAEEKHYEIVDVDFVKEGANWYLKVFGDKEGGFTINDCVDTSHFLDDKLESIEDSIEIAYILEVSSPGLDRPLKKDKDYIRSVGKLVEVKLYQARTEGPFAGQKEFIALLAASDIEKQEATLETEEGEQEVFSRKDFAAIRLAVIF
ncbi:MAG: ribosome maturation factor RimP [Firmicutes bacterium]|nr:ribosome maturation factor RimP [Bacillota bacterium]